MRAKFVCSCLLFMATGEPWLLVGRPKRIRSWFVHFLIESGPQSAAARRGR